MFVTEFTLTTEHGGIKATETVALHARLLTVCNCVQRRRPAPKVEMGTSSHNDVDLSWIPQETLNQISMYSPHTALAPFTAALPAVCVHCMSYRSHLLANV